MSNATRIACFITVPDGSAAKGLDNIEFLYQLPSKGDRVEHEGMLLEVEHVEWRTTGGMASEPIVVASVITNQESK